MITFPSPAIILIWSFPSALVGVGGVFLSPRPSPILSPIVFFFPSTLNAPWTLLSHVFAASDAQRCLRGKW